MVYWSPPLNLSWGEAGKPQQHDGSGSSPIL